MKKRILSILLCCVMLMGLLPTTAFAAETKAADTDKAAYLGTGRLMQLGTSGINGYSAANSYEYVYYGYWNNTDKYYDPNPIKWRVLDGKTNNGQEGVFLLSEALFGMPESVRQYCEVYFNNKSGLSQKWQDSDAQAYCRDFAGESGNQVPDVFSEKERNAILKTYKSDEAYEFLAHRTIFFGAAENILNGDRVFCLSAEEATNKDFGFTSNRSRLAYFGTRFGVNKSARDHWLRSGDTGSAHWVGFVGKSDGAIDSTLPYAGDMRIRPAMNIDASRVLFSSPAANDNSITSGTGSKLAAVGKKARIRNGS